MILIPRPILMDAYTISGFLAESQEAMDWSTYYGTFRSFPKELEKWAHIDDERMLFSGLPYLIDNYVLPLVTRDEIEESRRFLENRKYTTNGLAAYEFPEKAWRFIVDELGGKIPLSIEAMPEGSVVYPGEPAFRVRNTIKGFGWLAAAFEAVFLKTWASSMRLTFARHWLEYVTQRIIEIESMPYEKALALARLQVHDFGMRGSMTLEEDLFVAMQHLYCFGGTDTFPAAYVAWKNGAPSHEGGSVWALAHRIVQGYAQEEECYRTMYEKASNGAILSMVADCYDYKNAITKYLVPLAKRAASDGSGKLVVARPDSGDPVDMVTWTVKTAIENGLCTQDANGWYNGTTLKFIEGDGMTFDSIDEIYDALVDMKCKFWNWGLFGIGGFLHNSITRDICSTKYALCEVGEDRRSVIKFSNTPGKSTLPNVIVSRSKTSLENEETIKHRLATANLDAMQIVYFNGAQGARDDFNKIQNRVLKDFVQMPLFGGLKSLDVLRQIEDLRKEYVYENK